MVGNLVVEIAIYNFDLFQSALMFTLLPAHTYRKWLLHFDYIFIQELSDHVAKVLFVLIGGDEKGR